MKNDLRSFFVSVKGYIYFKPFLAKCGISASAFSKFMKGEVFNYEVAEDKLILLRDSIIEFCEKIA